MTAALLWSAVAIAAFHTVIGVDHYVPFVALGRARRWSLAATLGVAAACGAGHVLASAVLGALLIGFGWSLQRLAWIDTTRGAFVAWMLVAFGVAYALWGLVRARRGRRHEHAHVHADGTIHRHPHTHHEEHLHPHAVRSASVWAMFVLFAFGPCETLVPLMAAPAMAHDWALVGAVATVFGAVTIATMLLMTTALRAGLSASRLRAAERYEHCAAGAAVAASGILVLLGA